MKKIYIILVLFVFLTHCTRKTKQPIVTQKEFNGKVYWSFNAKKSDIIAQSGEFKVLVKEIEALAPFRSLKSKENEIIFILFYKQFVSSAEKPPKKINLSLKKLSRSPESILNQYGVPPIHSVKLEFSSLDPSKGFAQIDGQIIKKSDLDLKNYIWASFATEMFHFQLSAIDKILKRQMISAEAKKLGMNTQNYLDEHVFKELSKELTESNILTYLKKYNIDDEPRNRELAKTRLLDERKKRGVDYILEKFVMSLPVEINLTPPDFELEIKNEWTPFFGNSQGDLNITLFSDTKSSTAEKLLTQMTQLTQQYKNIKVHYRPLFSPQDQLQNLTSQMHFCVWMIDPKNFTPYLLNTLGDFKEKTEETLYQKAKELKLNVDPLKKCLIAQQYKDVVDYHLKYAQYLGLHAGPIVFIGGEVIHGAVRVEDIEKIIHRKLEIPSAGVW